MAGAQRAFAAYFGERILITLDVARELEEACVYVPGLLAFLGTWPAAQAPVDLPVELKLKAADILGFVADDPRASLQDLGEVTSILMAQHLRDAGQCQDPLLLVDDQRHGKALAAVRGLTIIDTPRLIIEMVCAGAMSRPLGAKVWRVAFSDRSKWPLFDERINAALAGR